MYVANIFYICSLVCFLVYGVNRRQALIAKPRLYFPDLKGFAFGTKMCSFGKQIQ